MYFSLVEIFYYIFNIRRRQNMDGIRLLFLTLCFYFTFMPSAISEKKDCTELARDEEALLVYSTLGGGLTAIDPITSEVRWTIEDEPAVKAVSQTKFPVRQYLPDPRDGSLYQLGDSGGLKKLPYTIPQLVANAPCRSSDGILYSGKKSDTWFLIDPKTGRREKLMGFGQMDGSDSIGWATSRSVYLGRTQYTVMMFDSLAKDKNTKPWNITFYDYASHTMAPEISSDYEYIHLAGSSTGLTATLDRKMGKFIWQTDLSSPVIAVFLLGPDGLLNIPFTTVADDALRNMIEEATDGSPNDMKLFQSLYIGEHLYGLYALPSLVDKDTATISMDPPVKLIEGPYKNAGNIRQNLVHLNELLKQDKNAIVLGHYQMPKNVEELELKISPTSSKGFDNKELATIANLEIVKNDDFILIRDKQSIGVQTDSEKIDSGNEENVNSSNVFNENQTFLDKKRLTKFLYDSKTWISDHQILLVLIPTIAMFWYTYSTVRELRQQSQNSSQTLNRGSGSSNVSLQDLEDLGNGEIKIGKISFNCNKILGKGCEGTFVFKGTFEEREVAVKRLLPGCFTFADREVALLRESDAHENVVRYFCTEQDRQFRYIAVELCAATLQDYTEGDRVDELRSQIEVFEVLRQSAAGLSHLHSLNIVHRDVKPQNVLISLPDVNNKVRAMLSDFGLCKKLNYGKASFSRRSGITGTEGWIAPEMMKGQRTTTSVDIFSLGCVFYYVLTNGRHVFGDSLKRQANILSNEFDLSHLTGTKLESNYILAEQLIADMVQHDSHKRPTAHVVCNHPIFWKIDKIQAFLQDVSDRVEKLSFDTEPLKTLEKNGRVVVREDWNLHLEPEITSDLRKYRGYMGASVRDLLRAFRNKKHHYHELSPEAQALLGTIPHEFTEYWIKRFPHLVSHAYHALSMCSHENPFKSYYDSKYKFTRPDYFDAEDNEVLHLLADPKRLQRNDVPKKFSPEKSQKLQRRGAYNFHRKHEETEYNVSRSTNDGDENPSKPNLFSNFRLRGRSAKGKSNHQREKNVAWTLPTKVDPTL